MRTTSHLFRTVALASLLAVVMGCQTDQRPSATRVAPAGGFTDSVGRPSDPAGSALPAGQGGIRVGIRWPDRTVQVIPADIASLTLKARDGSGDPPVVLTLLRDGTTSLATGSLQPLRPGSVTVSAEALSTSGALLASGSTIVDVAPNTISTASITLGNVIAVRIANIDPKVVMPGQPLTITGSGFGWTSRLPLQVLLDGKPLPESAIATRSDTTIVVEQPEDLATASVTVAVAGKTATYRQTITRIASISLKVTREAPFAPAGVIALSGHAYDAFGNVLDPFALASLWARRCDGGECGANERLKELFVQGSKCLILPEAPGEISIRLGNDHLHANATFPIRAFSRAELARWNLGPMPSITPVPRAEFELGERLFHESSLSANKSMSCATCHQDALGGADGQQLGTGNDGKPLGRHVPSIWNTAFQTLFNWDGKADSLEAQHLLVFENPREFATTRQAVTATLQASASYVQAFQQVYGQAPDDLLARKAIATYVKAHVAAPGRLPDGSPNPAAAPFDRWVLGDDSAMSANQIKGLAIFMGKANCAACHNGPLFSDNKFHNIGFDEFGTGDPGRRDVTGLPSDQGNFKTPTLRNIDQTAPYFHNGSQPDLFGAVHFYERFATKAVNLSPEMQQPPDMKTDPDGPDGPQVGDWDALIEFHHALTAPVTPVVSP
ncbi:MAG: cytochrome c peroxidase [Candidatus Sericytochromatia bacterium]|nr:cytochrome c peroxidase [Candidatus Sericytochromatia bacterium]